MIFENPLKTDLMMVSSFGPLTYFGTVTYKKDRS